MAQWEASMSTPVRRKTADVPDSWDAIEDDDGPEDVTVVKDEDSNVKLWQQSDMVEERMPEVVLQTNSLSTGASMSNASAAVLSIQQPKTMRILKRPSNNTPPLQQVAGPVLSMKEREVAYAAARDRIFNAPSPASSSASGTPIVPSPSMTPPPTLIAGRANITNNTANQGDGGARMERIIRDPIGPVGDDRGFKRQSQNADKASQSGSWNPDV